MQTIQVPDNLIRHNGQYFRPVEEDGFRGYLPWALPNIAEDKPVTLTWLGAPMSLITIWHPLMAFFERQYSLTHGEAQARLFYNHQLRQWKVWAFPQEWSMSMTTTEINHEDTCHCIHCQDKTRQREAIGPGFEVYGTIHHHCASGAFQSGTDQNDEHHQNGIHITVGHLGSTKYDLDGRVYLGRIKYDVLWYQWFDLSEPDWLRGLTDEQLSLLGTSRDAVREKLLTTPPPITTPFPEVWMENLIKKEYQGTVGYHTGSGGAHTYPRHNSYPHHAPQAYKSQYLGGPCATPEGHSSFNNGSGEVSARTILQSIVGMARKWKLNHIELRSIIEELCQKPWSPGLTHKEKKFVESFRKFAEKHGFTNPQLASIAFNALAPVENTSPLSNAEKEIIEEVALLCATLNLHPGEAFSLAKNLAANPLLGTTDCKIITIDAEKAYYDGLRGILEGWQALSLAQLVQLICIHLEFEDITAARSKLTYDRADNTMFLNGYGDY